MFIAVVLPDPLTTRVRKPLPALVVVVTPLAPFDIPRAAAAAKQTDALATGAYARTASRN